MEIAGASLPRPPPPPRIFKFLDNPYLERGPDCRPDPANHFSNHGVSEEDVGLEEIAFSQGHEAGSSSGG